MAANNPRFIARELLFPGNLPRKVLLVQAGARSVRLVLGPSRCC